MRRLVLSPRWILWHLLTLGAMATCVWLAAWQWQRAGSAMGSALNIGYGLQWPLFAVFFGVMWWRFLRMEAARLHGADGDPAEPGIRAAEPPPVRAPLHGPNPFGPVQSGPAPSGRSPSGSTPSGPSPFGPRPAGVRPAAIDEDSALAAYNRMLAQLAARNPED